MVTTVQGTPGDIDPHARTVITIVQGTPGSINPHDEISANLEPGDSFSPPERIAARAWTITLLPGPSLLLTPNPDPNGDGAPSIGMSEISGAMAPTVVWSRSVSPGNHDPVYAQYVNGAWTAPAPIATDPGDDRDPRWLQDATGTVHAVWWRAGARGDGGEVLYAARMPSSSAFSSAEVVSLAGEAARTATLAVRRSGEVFVAYETDAVAGSRSIVVARRPGPGTLFKGVRIAQTLSERAAEPELLRKGGQLWLTWVDTDSRLGYSEFSHGSWTTPSYEALGPAETAAEARIRIADKIAAGRQRMPALPGKRPLSTRPSGSAARTP